MYTNQALWTMAREGLPITVVLLANARYAILQTEMQRAGVADLGPVGRSLTTLSGPPIDWAGMAQALGVPVGRCRTNGELALALADSWRADGPYLIEVDLDTLSPSRLPGRRGHQR